MDSSLPTQATRPPSLAELARLTDEQLMIHLKNGCNDALAVLFTRYNRLVLSIALRIVRDPGEAEDVMQAVFLEIFRAVGQFDPAKGTTKVWLLQYAYHRAFNRRQYLSARNFYNEDLGDVLRENLAERVTAIGNFEAPELKLLIKQGLKSLSKPQRHVIELSNYDGLSMKEIAEKTGESLSNVRHHYYRGLEKLHNFISGTSKSMNAGGAHD